MMLNARRSLFSVFICSLACFPASALHGQQAANPPASSQQQPAAAQDQEPDPLKRERSDKEKFAAQKALRQELKGTYKTWLSQDAAYIISDEEQKAFKSLSNDEERDAF